MLLEFVHFLLSKVANRIVRSKFCRLILAFVACWFGAGVLDGVCADYVVINTDDQGPGSLRQAIMDANDHPGLDRIVFDIPGSNVHRIIVASLLPILSDSVIVEGYTQPGSRPNTLPDGDDAVLLIRLDGSLLTGAGQGAGLSLSGGSSSVRGLVINGFSVGILLDSPRNTVVGNIIGPEPTGSGVLPNGDGVVLGSFCCNTVGGAAPADRNVIAGNGAHTILVSDLGLPPATDCFILGNFLNVDRTGRVRLTGGGTTIAVRSAVRLTLGGLDPGAGNVIAPNLLGVHLYTAPGTQILGNNIGVGADGTTSVGASNTVRAVTSIDDVRIESNRIAFGQEAVLVTGSRVTLSKNLIYSNTVWGINLGDAALTNDVLDADAGPNGLQNYPTLTEVLLDTNLIIRGYMDSQPNTTYTLEFFANRTPNPNGRGEGQFYLGSTEVTTADNGSAPFEAVFPPLSVSTSWVAATATDPGGNTSTFSPVRQARSNTILQIHDQPTTVLIPPGQNATFRVNASGGPPIFYQWLHDGIELSGATNAVLTVIEAQYSQRGSYVVRIANPFGTLESQPAELTFLILPIFVQHPIGQTIAPGEYVTLSAVVTNATPLPVGFRWRSNSTFIGAYSPGDPYASFLTVRPQLSTRFTVVVTNAAIPAGLQSGSAIVVVGADRDHDGLPDDYEVRAGLDPDDPTDADGDLDQDGVSNREEYLSGTDAHDANSYLKLKASPAGAGGVTLEFVAASNKTYSVQFKDDAAGEGWHTLTRFPARSTNSVQVEVDGQSRPQRYYRLVTPGDR